MIILSIKDFSTNKPTVKVYPDNLSLEECIKHAFNINYCIPVSNPEVEYLLDYNGRIYSIYFYLEREIENVRKIYQTGKDKSTNC